jgi:hypothetical protein
MLREGRRRHDDYNSLAAAYEPAGMTGKIR